MQSQQTDWSFITLPLLPAFLWLFFYFTLLLISSYFLLYSPTKMSDPSFKSLVTTLRYRSISINQQESAHKIVILGNHQTMQRENTKWYFVLKCIHFQKSTDLGIQWHCRDGVSHDWSQICYGAVDGHLRLILLPHLSNGGVTNMYQAWHKILKQKLKKNVEISFLPFVWVSTFLRKECEMCVCACMYVYLSIFHMGTWGCQETALGPLELELLMVIMSCPHACGNWTQELWKSSKHS